MLKAYETFKRNYFCLLKQYFVSFHGQFDVDECHQALTRRNFAIYFTFDILRMFFEDF